MARSSSSTAGRSRHSRAQSTRNRVLLITGVLASECRGLVVKFHPPPPVFGHGHQASPSSTTGKRYRKGMPGSWMPVNVHDPSNRPPARSGKRRPIHCMGAESGANMGFDLSSDLGARMGSFVDGYRGFSLEESPVLLSLLNDDQMGLLSEITDAGTTSYIVGMTAEMTGALQSAIHLTPLPAKAWETTEDMFKAVDSYLAPAKRVAWVSLSSLGMDAEKVGLAVAALSVLGTAAVLAAIVSRFGGESPPLPTEYNLEKLDKYYKRKPLVVARRFVEVSSSLAGFALSVLADVLTNNWDTNMQIRAVQMREFTSSNGPAFIKVGQGASIRPDILPAPYLEEMQKLQDRVPEFSSREARGILERELGVPASHVFEDVRAFDKPIAAASLGQVYKAKLRGTGETVAVKIQRPQVLATVTRDLYVIRMILDLLSSVSLISDAARSVKSLIDSWAVRFMEEMDYTLEANNAERFAREMASHKTLGSAVKVPRVFSNLTTRYIIITEWVEGQKASSLEARTPAGKACLATLQATLLNSYLVQLLDNGFLHADPHPGNFLLQDDGTLCVLDFGLMTEVTEEQSYALLEYVCHLIAKDYPATLDDLIVLGFISPEVGDDPEKVALVVPLLAKVMEQLSEGGGAQTITIDSVGEEVEELAKNYPICIPAYFGLIIRCFGTLEGLGLSIDPGYSIVKECFPYLCRRLLTEDSPRMRRMLKSFLYGKDGDFLQVDRVDEILEGYRTFTALAAEVGNPGGSGVMSRPALREQSSVAAFATDPGLPSISSGTLGDYAAPGYVGHRSDQLADARSIEGGRARRGRNGVGVAYFDPSSDPVVVDALRLLFAKEGNYVQDLVVEELARMTDALGREVNLEILQVLRRLADGVMEPIPMTSLSFRPAEDGQLNPLLLPIQLPYLLVERIITGVESVLRLTEADKETLRAMQRLVEILRRATVSPSSAKNPLTAGAAERRGSALDDAYHDKEEGLSIQFASSMMKTIPSLRPRHVAATAKKMAPLVPEVMPGAQVMAGKFMRRLAGRALARIADNVMPEGTAAAEARDLLADQAGAMSMGLGDSRTIVGATSQKSLRKIVG